jgi:hypothetical protein
MCEEEWKGKDPDKLLRRAGVVVAQYINLDMLHMEQQEPLRLQQGKSQPEITRCSRSDAKQQEQ